MSFFGLTSFGPENYIKSNQIKSNGKFTNKINLGFTLFSEDDFKQGFEKNMNSRNTPGKLYPSDLKNFLSYSFGFTPLDDEINRIYIFLSFFFLSKYLKNFQTSTTKNF